MFGDFRVISMKHPFLVKTAVGTFGKNWSTQHLVTLLLALQSVMSHAPVFAFKNVRTYFHSTAGRSQQFLHHSTQSADFERCDDVQGTPPVSPNGANYQSINVHPFRWASNTFYLLKRSSTEQCGSNSQSVNFNNGTHSEDKFFFFSLKESVHDHNILLVRVVKAFRLGKILPLWPNSLSIW